MANQAITLANQLIDVCNRAQALNNAAGHMIAAADYSLLETEFGLTVGTGANFATLLGNLNNILNTSTEVVGATRLAQLQEFMARLAGQ